MKQKPNVVRDGLRREYEFGIGTVKGVVRIPSQGGQSFRRKADTDSDGSRTVIPIDPGQP